MRIRFYFRPSQSDVLHIDVWQNGVNWIKDSGTYSYLLEKDDSDAFQGTKGHSTITF